MLKDDIFYLASRHGVTGSESEVAEAAAKLLRPLAEEVWTDALGNVMGRVSHGVDGAPRLLLSAHLDQVGLIIVGVTETGFARVATMDADLRVMLGTKFLVMAEGGAIPCCSVAVPPHIQEPGDDERPVDISMVWLDLGMDGTAARRRVHPGDTVVYDIEPTELLNRRLTGAALDDRVGVACVLDALRTIRGQRTLCNIYVLFTTMEEDNHQGCLAAVRQLHPDYMIVVDACHGRTPGCLEYERVHDLGCGAVIAFGMNSASAFASRLVKVAVENMIPFDREALPGKSFTDAWVAQTANEGVYTAVVSYPLRYMHTPTEVVDLGDAEAVSALLARACVTFEGLDYE